MITSSLHNHCNLCDGKDSPEEMAAAAFRAGITDFGFSSHSYASFDMGASVKDERDYIEKIKSVIKNNDLPVNLYLGTEEDLFCPVTFREEYDYIIGSVHYVERKGKIYAVDISGKVLRRCIDESFSSSPAAFYRAYFENMVECARKKPDILGHFDIIRLCGEGIIDFCSRDYTDAAIGCIDECLNYGVIVEVNYGGVARGKVKSPYPDEFLLKRILEKNGRVTVTNDCHDAKFIAYGLNSGEQYLKSLGFKSVTVMKNGKFVEQSI